MTDLAGVPQIVFVDDDKALRDANAQTLQLAGLAVTAFADAASALKVLNIDFSGVVVSDIRMPRMDGLQFTAAIRAIDPEIPVILITGHSDVETAVSALKDGAFDFIAKPSQPTNCSPRSAARWMPGVWCSTIAGCAAPSSATSAKARWSAARASSTG